MIRKQFEFIQLTLIITVINNNEFIYIPSPTQSEPKSHWYPPIWIHIHTAYLSLVNDPTLPLLVLAALPLFCLYDDFVALLPPCSHCIALRLYTASSLVKLFSFTFNVLSEALNSCTCWYMYEKIRKASHCSCNENHYWSNKRKGNSRQSMIGVNFAISEHRQNESP